MRGGVAITQAQCWRSSIVGLGAPSPKQASRQTLSCPAHESRGRVCGGGSGGGGGGGGSGGGVVVRGDVMMDGCGGQLEYVEWLWLL